MIFIEDGLPAPFTSVPVVLAASPPFFVLSIVVESVWLAAMAEGFFLKMYRMNKSWRNFLVTKKCQRRLTG